MGCQATTDAEETGAGRAACGRSRRHRVIALARPALREGERSERRPGANTATLQSSEAQTIPIATCNPLPSTATGKRRLAEEFAVATCQAFARDWSRPLPLLGLGDLDGAEAF